MNNIFIIGNARFTVLNSSCIRLEYAKNGAFVNSETLFAKRNAKYEGTASYEIQDGIHIISFENIKLFYKGGEFSHDTLWVESEQIKSGVWHFGDSSKENLKGTLTTLDGVSSHRDTPDGLLSREGVFYLSDSNTAVLRSGWVENRSDDSIYDGYLFIYGDNYKKALSSLADVSGAIEMPRKYFFGSWYSRWHKYTDKEFLQIVDEYDENGFPLDVLVMDMDWHYHDWGQAEEDPKTDYGYSHATNNGWTGYTWNRHVIPEPEKLIDELHRRGIAVTLNDHPADGIRDFDITYESFLEELHEKGYKEVVPDVTERLRENEVNARANGTLKENYRFNAGSRDYMDAFFNATSQTMENMGSDFRWLDWQQDYLYPSVHGIPSLTHLKWLNHLYYEHSKKGGKRGQSFSRWGGFGDHKHPAYFSGDAVSLWETLDYEIEMTVTAGNALCFWWSHDIGGFEDPVKGGQSELYARWVQFGSVSPALRIHVCGELDRRPWKWGKIFCDSMRASYRLRSKLFPYIYSEAYESARTSNPLLRALYIEHPKCEEAYKHPSTYYFGSGIIAAPVTKAGEGERYMTENSVWLPEGEWYNYFDSSYHIGGNEAVSKDDLFSFPLYIKAGYPIASREYTSRMASDSLDPIIKIYCGKTTLGGASALYEDDGVSEGYKNGEYRRTEIRYTKAEQAYMITLTPTGLGYKGEAEKRNIMLELIDCEPVSSTSLGCLSYNSESRTATVKIEGISPADSLEITVK